MKLPDVPRLLLEWYPRLGELARKEERQRCADLCEREAHRTETLAMGDPDRTARAAMARHLWREILSLQDFP